jgi:site-specific DNA-cytosine methylase
MKTKTTFHVFAGVGGGALADLQNKLKPVGLCEFDPEAQEVLKLRFPKLPLFPDVRTLTGAEIIAACGPIHRLSGGSPCQDLSVSGKKAGFDGGVRSSLIWNQVRLLSELNCTECLWENVGGALGELQKDGLLKFFSMLRDAGYGAAFTVLGSGHYGANHARPRVWLLARKGFDGFHEVASTPMPARKYFHTPMASDADDSSKPMPANLRRNSPKMPTQIFMPDIREGMTIEEVNAVVGDRRLNPEYVGQSLAFPPSWTDLTVPYTADDIAINLTDKWRYPAPFMAKQRAYEYPKVVPVSKEQLPAWRARTKQHGNCQDRIVAAAADRLLSEYMDNFKGLF